MSQDKLQQLVGSLAKAINANERLAAPIVAAKLAKCSAAYPQDKTLGMMARVVHEMAYKECVHP